MFNAAFNFAEKNGIPWKPCACDGAPLDLDASLRNSRFTKFPVLNNPFPNPATFPYGNGIGALPMFMGLVNGYVWQTAFGKNPYGPGVNSVPSQPNFYSNSMMIFPTLPKENG